MFSVKEVIIPGAGNEEIISFSGCSVEVIEHSVPVMNAKLTASIRIGTGPENPLTLGSVYTGRNGESFERITVKGSQFTAGAKILLLFSDDYREPLFNRSIRKDEKYIYDVPLSDFDTNPIGSSTFGLTVIPPGSWILHRMQIEYSGGATLTSAGYISFILREISSGGALWQENIYVDNWSTDLGGSQVQLLFDENLEEKKPFETGVSQGNGEAVQHMPLPLLNMPSFDGSGMPQQTLIQSATNWPEIEFIDVKLREK
jgi:hypothetical protein